LQWYIAARDCGLAGCSKTDPGNFVWRPGNDPGAARCDGASARFALKVPFVDRDKTEHMWVGDVRAKGDGFEGVIDNDPVLMRHKR
jgi:hypothetical protein